MPHYLAARRGLRGLSPIGSVSGGVVPPGPYTAYAADYDSFGGYLTSTGLSGAADGSQGIFSVWLRQDGADAAARNIIRFESTGPVLNFSLTTAASGTGIKYQLNLANAGATVTYQAVSNTVYNSSKTWRHILISWDTNFTAGNKVCHFYINDTNDKGTVTDAGAAFNVDWTNTLLGVAASNAGANRWAGCIGELYLNISTTMDFSTTSNRRKFIDASGLPVDLGSDGSTPTGSAPILYLKTTTPTHNVNSGTGGNFTFAGVTGLFNAAYPTTTPTTSPAYVTQPPAVFAGASGYLRGANLSGAVDARVGTCSFWMRIDGGDGTNMSVFNNGSATVYFAARRASTNTLRFSLRDSTGVLSYVFESPALLTANTKWIHVLASWTTNAGVASKSAQIYINDVSSFSTVSDASPAFDIEYTSGDFAVAENTAAGELFIGALAELWIDTTAQMDFSITANRRKFINADFTPVNLGSNGSTPTGSQPIVYLANAVTTFGTNLGSGGNLTLTGTTTGSVTTPNVGYTVSAADFDGTNDYMTKAADLSGSADGSLGTISFWFKLDGGDNNNQSILVNTTGASGLVIRRTNTNLFRIILSNAAGTSSLTFNSTDTFTTTALSGWHNIIASWDTNAGAGLKTLSIYLDNVALAGTLTDASAAFTVDYTRTQWAVGAVSDASQKFNGNLADMWLDITAMMDITLSANRAKFIDQTTMRPVFLGATGATPTGSQPILFLNARPGSFGTNAGSGGDFTITGALDPSATTPSGA